jgi:hypothetical protein
MNYTNYPQLGNQIYCQKSGTPHIAFYVRNGVEKSYPF